MVSEWNVRKSEARNTFLKYISFFVLLLLLIIITCMAGCPRYSVWSKEMRGKSSLKEAEWTKRITIEEANAKKDSAKSLAEAEVIRARGVAEANKIIGKSLQGNDGYLRYLWIQGLSENNSDVIYVPTETNLPILEASRLKNK